MYCILLYTTCTHTVLYCTPPVLWLTESLGETARPLKLCRDAGLVPSLTSRYKHWTSECDCDCHFSPSIVVVLVAPPCLLSPVEAAGLFRHHPCLLVCHSQTDSKFTSFYPVINEKTCNCNFRLMSLRLCLEPSRASVHLKILHCNLQQKH